MYDVNKYKCYAFETVRNDGSKVPTVVAISTYAGKTVKGYAKLDPKDEFNWEKGRDLAIARCNAKIAAKREARAQMKLAEALEILDMAKAHLNDMLDYHSNSTEKLAEANAHVTKVLSKM